MIRQPDVTRSRCVIGSTFLISISLLALCAPVAAREVVNVGTEFDVFIDGLFDDWSDVEALGFVIPESPDEPLLQGPLENPEINGLFAAVVRGRLLHMYLVSLFRTDPEFEPGQVVAEIRVPFFVGGRLRDNFTLSVVASDFDRFEFRVDLEGDGVIDAGGARVGIEGAVGFGPSPLSPDDHLMIEIGLPIRNGTTAGVNVRGETEMVSRVVTDDDDRPLAHSEIVFQLIDRSEALRVASNLPDIEDVMEKEDLFLRGDCNGDGQVEGQVTDAVFLLTHNFLGGPEPACVAACDVSGDGDVLGTVTDSVYLLMFNFLGGPPPVDPFPECGDGSLDTDESLGCETPPESCR